MANEGYVRATGVNEKMYQCMEKGTGGVCGHQFRSGSKVPACPICQSTNVRDVRGGRPEDQATANGPARMITR
jgi:hypothetical protein